MTAANDEVCALHSSGHDPATPKLFWRPFRQQQNEAVSRILQTPKYFHPGSEVLGASDTPEHFQSPQTSHVRCLWHDKLRLPKCLSYFQSPSLMQYPSVLVHSLTYLLVHCVVFDLTFFFLCCVLTFFVLESLA